MVGLINKEDIYDIADAIREKTQTEDTFKPSEMGDLIRSIRVIPENSYQLKELTVPTPIATFDADALPMPKLKVSVDAVQDLHGYDKPWAGGAGKNKLPQYPKEETVNGIVWTVNEDGSLTAKGTATERSVFYYLLNDDNWYISGSIKATMLDKNGDVIPPLATVNAGIRIGNTWGGFNSVTMDVDGVLSQAWFSIDILNTAVDYTIYPIVYDASLSPTPWTPHSNICPISGFTEANVVVSPTTDAEDGTTYNIQFKDGDNPLTVYGGTLDVVSGVLVVDRGYVDLGTLNYTYNNGFFITSELASTIKKPSDNLTKVNAISSIYVAETWNAISNTDNGKFAVSSSNGEMIICNLAYTSASDFKTAMDGVQLVYELATPQTYQLTPTQVKSLLGSNNVWADTGNILEGEYFKAL